MVRTIDNLGPDVSQDFAKRTQQEDVKLVGDSRTVSAQAAIDTTQPVYVSQLSELFPTGKHTWSVFFDPPNYKEQNRIFINQVVPAFGDEEQKQAFKQRIDASQELLEHQNYEYPWQKDQEKEDWTKESTTFIHLIDRLSVYDKIIDEIKNNCGALYKG